jgi:soluble lytic murein transglycosylase-like protein
MKCLFALIALAIATPASAELIFFSEQRSMSVASHRFEGDRIIVALRGGGEMSFDRALIAKIAPDEVPYPEAARPVATPAIQPDVVTGQLAGQTAYDPFIERAATRHDVDARIVKAVIQVESAFQPRARSPKGAMGLMQLMPTTARHYQARNPYDPASNIEAGTKYLKQLLTEFELPLALAAYNAGEAAVRRFGGIPPYAETQAYVAKVLGLLKPM